MKLEKKKQIFLLIGLIILLFLINYNFLDKKLEEFFIDYETGVVDRIIDGDTIVINGTSVRLLGINCPEKGELYYEEGKKFLENVILNKMVELKIGKEKYDKYSRKLAYVFYKDVNVNLELVKEGYANFYFPSDKDEYYEKFLKNWEHCLTNNKYLCEKSKDKCAGCVIIKEFDYENEIIIFYNLCNFNCNLTNWTIKDEGRKKFTFPKFVLKGEEEVKIKVGEGSDSENLLFWEDEEYVWTKTGDSLFLRDGEGKFILWRSY